MTKSKPIHQLTIPEFEKMFPHEDACCAYLVANRWPEGVKCPRCGMDVKHNVSTMPWKWQCYGCAPNSGYRFSHLTGTIFENTNKPLREWFRVIHLMLTSKKGISALQIQRMMGFGAYKTAWYMCHRIRAGLQDKHFRKLLGVVEVDEAFIGGLAKNRHKDKRGPGGGYGGGGGIGSGKTPIAGAVSRKGRVVARVIENVSADTLTKFIRETVSSKVSLVCTDSWKGYGRIGGLFPHATVDHKKGEYVLNDDVIGAIHTQTIEGFWSIFKRGVVGSFHKVSRKYMALYVAEFCFRYNNRENPDIFGEAIRGC